MVKVHVKQNLRDIQNGQTHYLKNNSLTFNIFSLISFILKK